MDETRHFYQLYLCRKENIKTFNAGVDALLTLGFSKKDINKGLRKEQTKQIMEKLKTWLKKILHRLFSRYAVDGSIVITEQ